MIKEKKMFKDTPKGLLEAVLAVNKGTREKYIEEQRRKMATKMTDREGPAMTGIEGPADRAAHPDARKMAEELSGKQHRIAAAAKPTNKITADDFKRLRAGKDMKEGMETNPRRSLQVTHLLLPQQCHLLLPQQ
jgi:hypothetical protein